MAYSGYAEKARKKMKKSHGIVIDRVHSVKQKLCAAVLEESLPRLGSVEKKGVTQARSEEPRGVTMHNGTRLLVQDGPGRDS